LTTWLYVAPLLEIATIAVSVKWYITSSSFGSRVVFSVTVISVILDRVKENWGTVPAKNVSMVNISSTSSAMMRAINTTVPTGECTLTSNSYCVALKNATKPSGTAKRTNT